MIPYAPSPPVVGSSTLPSRWRRLGFALASPLALLGAFAATSVSVREARTELVLEPIHLKMDGDGGPCQEHGRSADEMFEFPWLPLLSNHLELSCNILRRCSGEAALDDELSSDRDLTVEQLANGTFVARWIEDVGARTDGISRGRIPRCARLRVVEAPSRPRRAAMAAAVALVVLCGWLLLRRARRRARGWTRPFPGRP